MTVEDLSFELELMKKEICELKKSIEILKSKLSFKCRKCKKIFSQKVELVKHINEQHKKHFSCNKCDYENIKLSEVENHMMEEHSVIVDFNAKTVVNLSCLNGGLRSILVCIIPM